MICFSKIISEGVFIMDQQKIGRFISELRKELGMTQTELGEKLGVSYKAVSKWETGRNLPDPSLYEHLCAALGITLTELFNGERIEQEHIAEKSDQIIKNVMESNKENKVLQIISAIATAAGTILIFVPALNGLGQTPSIVIISAGLLLLFIGMSFKLTSWKRSNGKTVKNTGMGFTSGLTLLFITLKLTGRIHWPWIWVTAPLWMGISLVTVLLAVIYVIGKIKKQW